MNDLATCRSICAETVPQLAGAAFEARTVPDDPQIGTNRVYFIYCARMVKIGHTNRVMRRLSEIKISTPFPAQIVLLMDGGRLTEDFLHFVFAEYHVRGEWFRLGPRLRETIERLAPDFCSDWLREDEETHRDWVADEAERLGLLPVPFAGGVG